MIYVLMYFIAGVITSLLVPFFIKWENIVNDDDTDSIPGIFVSTGFANFLVLMLCWPFTFVMEIITVFECLHDNAVNTRKKNKEYIDYVEQEYRRIMKDDGYTFYDCNSGNYKTHYAKNFS